MSSGIKGVVRLTVLLLALFAAACGEPAAELTPTIAPAVAPAPAPRPLTAYARILDNNSLIARIVGKLDAPGYVYLKYWSKGVGRFRSKTVASDGTNYAIHAVRLRANTRYNYQVFGTVPNGRVSEGPTGTFRTGALPETLRKARFLVMKGKPTHDLTFMEFGRNQGLLAIDGEGHIVWYYDSPREGERPREMAQKPNGNIVYLSHDLPVISYGLVEITPLGEEVDRLDDICPPKGPMHHEVHLLLDGRVMYMSRYILRPGYGDPPAPQEGDTIGIWDQVNRKNEIVWTMADFISPADRMIPDSNITLPGHQMWGGCDRDPTVQDWSHGNSTFMAADSSVLISLRHLDQIISIAPDFQSIQWRLGGPGSDFTFPDPSDKFYHQHTAVPLPNGNILLFDNGNFRPNKEGGQYSRALELALDFEKMTAKKVWEYRHDPDIFARCCSSVTRLENGNTLLVFGINRTPLAQRPFTIVEADAAGKVVWEEVHIDPGKAAQYRVYPGDSIMGEVRLSNE